MSLNFPSIYLLETNIRPEERRSLEESIPSLTGDAHKAKVLLGRITRRERALFELRRLKIKTVDVLEPSELTYDEDEPPSKRLRTSKSNPGGGGGALDTGRQHCSSGTVKVVRLSWLTDSLKQRTVLPTKGYLLYEGQKLRVADQPSTQRHVLVDEAPTNSPTDSIWRQAAEDTAERLKSKSSKLSVSPHSHHAQSRPSPVKRPALLHETTSDHNASLPPVPDFLQTTYSCQRPTPINTPNATFINELREIRTLRLLEGDQIAVRAYSTSIAALAAYPYHLQRSSEVFRLPGCGTKIAQLYQQWKDTGQVTEAVEATADSRLSILKLFYRIWGVGDKTAREFYNKGWRDLDDLVEYDWGSLSRVQQIGVKFYDEFQLKIPRAEVEQIGAIILSQARKVDVGFQMTIAGGYRRGKAQSGDVDVVLSHPDEHLTLRLIEKIVMSLEKSQHITHTLTLSTRNSDRGQAPLAWRGEGPEGSGFDTLDKALVVWQDPSKEDAPHRRVDIIVSPWKTVGCAVLGWSGGNTFQRDLRRYCKKEKGLKFDSSGVRSRTDGSWVDLEDGASAGPAPDMETAEKRVFEGLGLTWRPPEERCTG